MKRTSYIFSALALALFLWPASSSACGGKGSGHGRGFHRGGHGGMMKRLFKKLPPETRLKLLESKYKMKRQNLPLRASIKNVKAKLRLAITAAEPDMTKIKELIAKKYTLKQKKAVNKVKHLIRVQKLLTGKHQLIFRMKLLKGKRKHSKRRWRRRRHWK